MKQDERTPVYTEGVCGDGAMILRDGQPFPISSAIDALNAYTSTEASLTPTVERLRDALAKLANEVSALNAFDFEIRDVIGNTNWDVLKLREDEARAALSGSPAPSTEGLREWQPIETAKPENCIVAAWCEHSKSWAVGEAHFVSGYLSDSGTWWWANVDPGDYTGEDIISMGGMPTYWQPLPPAPDAARTALASAI